MASVNPTNRSTGSHTHTDGCRHHRPVNLFGYEFSSDDDSGFELESGEVIYSDEEDETLSPRPVEQNTLLHGEIDYSRFEAPPLVDIPVISATDGNDTETNDDLEVGLPPTASSARTRSSSIASPQRRPSWYRRLLSVAFPPSAQAGYARIGQHTQGDIQEQSHRKKRLRKNAVPVQLQWSWIYKDPLLFFRNISFSQLASGWFWLDLAKRMLFSVPVVLVTLLIVYDLYYFHTMYISITTLPIVPFLSSTTSPSLSFSFFYAIIASLLSVWHYIFFDLAAILTLLSYYRCWLTSPAVKCDPPSHGYYRELKRRLTHTLRYFQQRRHAPTNTTTGSTNATTIVTTGVNASVPLDAPVSAAAAALAYYTAAAQQGTPPSAPPPYSATAAPYTATATANTGQYAATTTVTSPSTPSLPTTASAPASTPSHYTANNGHSAASSSPCTANSGHYPATTGLIPSSASLPLPSDLTSLPSGLSSLSNVSTSPLPPPPHPPSPSLSPSLPHQPLPTTYTSPHAISPSSSLAAPASSPSTSASASASTSASASASSSTPTPVTTSVTMQDALARLALSPPAHANTGTGTGTGAGDAVFRAAFASASSALAAANAATHSSTHSATHTTNSVSSHAFAFPPPRPSSSLAADFLHIPMCTKCSAPKPPRAHHCSVCNTCVARMDHHCPWVGNCVGKKNHKYFVLFLIWAAIGCVLYLPVSIRIMIDVLSDDEPVNDVPPAPHTGMPATDGSLSPVSSMDGLNTLTYPYSPSSLAPSSSSSSSSSPSSSSSSSSPSSTFLETDVIVQDIFSKSEDASTGKPILGLSSSTNPYPHTASKIRVRPPSSRDPPISLLICAVMTGAFALVLSCFALFHVSLVMQGDTTLENMGNNTSNGRGVTEQRDGERTVSEKRRNWEKVFGKSVLLWFFPVPVQEKQDPWNGYEMIHPRYRYPLFDADVDYGFGYTHTGS